MRGVDGDEETFAAASFGMLDDFLGNGAVLVDVELEPLNGWGLLGKDIIGGGVDDLVEGAGGEGGYLNGISALVMIRCRAIRTI